MTTVPKCHDGFSKIHGRERFFYLGDRFHNTEGPAFERWDTQGRLRLCAFYVDGQLHNADGPAREKWHEDGELLYRQFWVNGKRHNANGPAWEHWNENGEQTHCSFYVHGTEMSEEAFRAWQERQQRQRELRALVFALEHKFPAEAPEREFLRHILPAFVAGGSCPL